MPRVFNTAGPCLADKHYMLSPERRLPQVRHLIEGEYFFVIHAPRQTGKTTLLNSLSGLLTKEGRYAALTLSLESFTSDDLSFTIPQILRKIEDAARYQLPEDAAPPQRADFVGDPSVALTAYLTAWSDSIDRPLVVFFDEVDALAGEVLVSVLRQLRSGYTARPAPFPQSVALVGMRDVRDYRVKLRNDTASLGTSSPFNIKVESLTMRNFDEAETGDLLEQHTAETGQAFDERAKAEVFRQTRGQPWLVNALAAQLTTRYDALVKDRSIAIGREQVLAAREILIQRRDTHLDSLVKRLREERVRRVIEPILVGESFSPDVYDDDLQYVEDLGLVARIDGTARIANPIYQEIVPRSLTHVTQASIHDDPAWYVAPDGTLDMGKLIEGFLKFWRRHGEVLFKGMPYHEAAPHLTFMAYLHRVVNAKGRVEREFAAGAGRADLWVRFGGREDVIELKILRGEHTLPEGLEQVARYAVRLGLDTAYLVIFNPRPDTPWEERGVVEEVISGGVKVVVVRA